MEGKADKPARSPGPRGSGKFPARVKLPRTTVGIMVPDELLSEIDLARDRTGNSRTVWICQAIRERLDSKKRD